MITEDMEERYAIIAEGCKVSQRHAEKLHAEQIAAMTLPEDAYKEKVKRLREIAESHRKTKPVSVPKHEPIIDRKSLASGETA
ncbi:MAG TPA: hypothetical protein VIM16_00190 [Mucilaginibacter sp.]|jgi:hypothetical protein